MSSKRGRHNRNARGELLLPGPGRGGKTRFQKGNKASTGRKPGSKNAITEAQRRYLAETGLTPLMFMALCYRDQLYDRYEYKKVQTVGGEVTTIPMPAKGARKLKLKVTWRLSAANAAAPYLHKKLPIAIEGGDRPLVVLSAEKLAQLSTKELQALLSIMDKLGVGSEVDGAKGTTYTMTDFTDAEILGDEDQPKEA